MTAAGPARLVASADLSVEVSAPDGRRTCLRVGDRAGVVTVEVDDVRVLLAALPGPAVRGSAAGALRTYLLPLLRRGAGGDGPGPDVPAWDQPVDVLVAGRLVLRRRGGRWLPSSGLAAPAAAVLGVVVVVATVVSLLRRVLRPRQGS